MDPNQILAIIGAYNDDPRSFTDEQAELVALLAKSIGADFRRENKPISKGLFNMADVGLLGMLPNEWEPWSRGQSVYGESFSEKLGSGIGTAAGLPLGLLSGYGLLRGGIGAAKGAAGIAKGPRGLAVRDWAKSKAGQAYQSGLEGYQKGRTGLSNLGNRLGIRPQIPQNPNNLFDLLDDLGNIPYSNIP
jgi:hypothetical protein